MDKAEWNSLTKDQQQDWQTYWNEDGNGDYDYLEEEEMKPYHNKGFGWAFLWIIISVLVFPAIILFTSLGTWDMFWKMHLPNGNCWENAKHEKVCQETSDCKFLRNFCK